MCLLCLRVVKKGCRCTIGAKCSLSSCGLKKSVASFFLDFSVPIDLSSLQRALAEGACSRRLARYCVLLVSILLHTCERSDLNLATKAGVPKFLATLNMRSRSFIITRRSGVTHGFSLLLILILRTGAMASIAAVIALVSLLSMASTKDILS